MARKRRAPSPAPPPPPPPPPPQESSAESGSETEAEEGEQQQPSAAAFQKTPQNPQPQPPAAAADGALSSEEESDSEADANAFQMRPVLRSPTKPAAAAPQPESDADEGEKDGEPSEPEPEPEVPEPVRKRVAVAKKAKPAEPDNTKRPGPDPAPSGRSKKAKAESGKAVPPASPTGKGKKAKAEPEKVAPDQTPPGKAKKPGGKQEKSRLDSPPPSSKSDKSARVPRAWSKEDLIRILEALADHVKNYGVLPKTDALLASLRDHLDRKDCSYSDLYERIRRFKERYEKAVSKGVVPSGEDELQMYNLSEAIWGKKATAATASQNDSAVTRSKKGQGKKEKMDGNSKDGTQKEEVGNQSGDSQKGSKKGQAIEAKTDKDAKGKLSKEDTTIGSPIKSKKQGNDREEFGKDAKNGTSKETTSTANQNGDASTKRKRGKLDKEKMDVDLMPKEASTGNQNGVTPTEGETHEEEEKKGATVQHPHRSFDELQNLYPNLAWCMENIETQHPCRETLRRAFGFIGDEKASALESKIKAQRLLVVKANMRRGDLQKGVLNMLIGLVD